MSDWFRSVTVLGIAFVTVIAVTSGLAIFIVPAPTVSSRASDAPSVDASGVAAPSVPGQVGGTITVSGARDEAFTLSREFTDGRYGLVGNEGRIYFDEDPLSVAQISFGGLEFILQPDDCVIEPGRRDDETGVADAHLRCESIEDVRGSGVVTLDGTIGIASDLLGLRGDLPPTGGTVAFGDRTVTFEEAEMLHPRITAFVGRLVDVEGVVALTLSYDGEARGLVINEVQTEGGLAEVAADACQLSTTEVGILNPHARLLELTIDCPSIDVPGIGLTTISGSLMVEEVEPQF